MRSAIALVKGVLSVASQVRPPRLHRALSEAIWEYTEADNKYGCRFRSAGAMREKDPKQLRHEHVLTRKGLVRALLQEPAHAEEILQSALACIVTKEEDARLRSVPSEVDGWERYRRAHIPVWDSAEDRWLIPPSASRGSE
jgi:hypothetical protein